MSPATIRHLLLATLLVFAACGAPKELRLATTTSTEASGLLGVLVPRFEAASGVKVRVISVGTGQALKLAERGDVDVVLVHSRPDEDRFMAAGFGSARYDAMYNDFILVGPASDPANLRGMNNATTALTKIAAGEHRFVSRGDDSGTHKKEMTLWKEAAITPKGAWYVASGQGMGEVLTMAGNLGAYALTDRGTYLAYRGKVGLIVVVEQLPGLYNPYGVMPVNPQKHPHVNHAAAEKFSRWLISPTGRTAIGSLKVDGQALFTPGAPPKVNP